MVQEDSPTLTLPSGEQQDSNGRNTLLEQGRSFLNSPAVHLENENAKRAFLLDKGLHEQEINTLLHETTPRILPPVPPRTYPPSPPSNLSLYITLLLRLTMWTVGITGTLAFLYKRLLLGRITASLTARHQLVLHQTDLITRLQNQVKALKDEQRTAYKPFIRSKILNTVSDDDDVSHIKSLQDITVDSDGTPSLSVDKIVWVVYNSSPDESSPSFTADEVVEQLDKVFPQWLQVQGWKETKERVLHELETSDLYSKSETQDTQTWSLSLTDPQPSNPETSLNKLRDTIVKSHKRENTFQYVFKSLTDFTAFLSRETFQFYTVDTAAFRRNYLGDTSSLSPIQDDVRKEIRALKGLVLNRRSFAPTPIRPPSFVTPPAQS